MVRPSLAIAAALAISSVGATGAAEAQIVRAWPGAGIVVRTPYAPPVSINVRGVVPGLPLVRPYLLPRRRALLAPPYVAASAPGQPPSPPKYAGPQSDAPRYAPGATSASADRGYAPASSAGDRDYPTPAELASFDDGTLLNVVLEVTAQLDADLGRFNTGAGWQKYLRLPTDALPPPSADGRVVLGFRSLETTLDRLNSVAANPQYPMIARMPSFVAAQNALAEVVSRFGAAAQVAADPPAAQSVGNHEELPVPPPSRDAPVNGAGAERSILRQ